MIRAAKFQDIPVILTMLHEMLPRSKYAGRVEISDKAATAMLESAIAAQGQPGPQGTHVIIAERSGEPVGFMLGVLDRIYHIGTKLSAKDAFLYVRPESGLAPVLALIDSYVGWASAKRPVIEIVLSWHDALPGAGEIARLYARKGFVKTGEIFEMRCDVEVKEAA